MAAKTTHEPQCTGTLSPVEHCIVGDTSLIRSVLDPRWIIDWLSAVLAELEADPSMWNAEVFCLRGVCVTHCQ